MAVSKEEIIGVIALAARTDLEGAKKPDRPVIDRLVSASKSMALFFVLRMLYPKSPSLWQGLQEAKDIKEQLVKEISCLIEGAV